MLTFMYCLVLNIMRDALLINDFGTNHTGFSLLHYNWLTKNQMFHLLSFVRIRWFWWLLRTLKRFFSVRIDNSLILLQSSVFRELMTLDVLLNSLYGIFKLSGMYFRSDEVIHDNTSAL